MFFSGKNCSVCVHKQISWTYLGPLKRLVLLIVTMAMIVRLLSVGSAYIAAQSLSRRQKQILSISALGREAFTHSMLCKSESFGACSILVSSIYQSRIILDTSRATEGLPPQTREGKKKKNTEMRLELSGMFGTAKRRDLLGTSAQVQTSAAMQ